MKMTIGFTANKEENETKTAYTPTTPTVEEPKKSVVTVFFPQRHFSCSYYNDSFDLKKGDIVYVDGKLEGKKGYVTDISYNFKIRLSDYKRVIAKANTDIKGKLFSAGSHFIAFDRNVLPKDTVSLWFKAPDKEEEIYEIGDDGESFLLSELDKLEIAGGVAESGSNYYFENAVKYLCLDGETGYATVEGSKPYEVTFKYKNGEISSLTCECYCTGICKHEFAVLLELREMLNRIEENYKSEYEKSGYFAAITKEDVFSVIMNPNSVKSIELF